jgi:hypothetical protein
MKKLIISILFLSAIALGQTTTNQTVITGARVSVPVLAGQTACQSSGSIFAPCDNTATNPPAAVGVFLTAGTPGRSGTPATIAVNGIVDAPVSFLNCGAGDLVGDIDGTGNLGDMGQPSTLIGPVSYVGVCQLDNPTLTIMQIVVQPGYVFASSLDPTVTSTVRKRAH